jgi:hypothetical protein
MGEPSLLFTSLWFNIYLWLTLEKYKITSWKNKEFEDLKDLLILFELYFVIVKDSLCSSTMYYLLQWIYVVLVVKKVQSGHKNSHI